MPRRNYISREALRALDASPAGHAGRAAFRFQDRSDCIAAAADMTRTALAAARARGVVQLPAREPGLLSRLAAVFCGSGMANWKGPVTARAIMDLNARHGPVQLILHRMLQPGQGAESYPKHHSAVVVASYLDEGRRIGVLVDGNTHQANPVMTALRGWMQAAGDTRRLSELGPGDFAAFDRACGRAAGLDVHQAAFRLVDLDQMTRAAHARPLLTGIRALRGDDDYTFVADYPNEIRYDGSARASAPMLPEPARSALVLATRRDPSLVEQFGAAS